MRSPRTPAVLALAALAAFVAAALSVHALRPELDWVHAQLSVYLLGPWGWLLQSAYVALAPPAASHADGG